MHCKEAFTEASEGNKGRDEFKKTLLPSSSPVGPYLRTALKVPCFDGNPAAEGIAKDFLQKATKENKGQDEFKNLRYLRFLLLVLIGYLPIYRGY
jgi:hypothetical protein